MLVVQSTDSGWIATETLETRVGNIMENVGQKLTYSAGGTLSFKVKSRELWTVVDYVRIRKDL